MDEKWLKSEKERIKKIVEDKLITKDTENIQATTTNKIEPEKAIKTIRELVKTKYIGCKNCGATNTTLIKATDSYYCKFCFNKLNKTKFQK